MPKRVMFVLVAALVSACLLTAIAGAHPIDVDPAGGGKGHEGSVGPDGHSRGVGQACEMTDANPAVVDFTGTWIEPCDPSSGFPPTPTSTPLVPTATFTPKPPTPTFTPILPTPTFTPVPPTPTLTPIPPTPTFTPAPPTPTFTPVPPTPTPSSRLIPRSVSHIIT